MNTTEAEILAVIERLDAALRDRDAATALACYTEDAFAYDLAPPLVTDAAAMHDAAGLERWFATWAGPIVITARDTVVRTGGDIAYVCALLHMTGEKREEGPISLWFRSTTCLARRDVAWKIAHVHNSVPFAMDGSGRALLDLQP